MLPTEEDYLKSCLNYTGGKHRLLHQMIPLFPKNIGNFVDLFFGGANVAINVESRGAIYAVDHQKEVIRLFNTLKQFDSEAVIRMIDHIIINYGLSRTNIYGYTKYGSQSSAGLAAYNKEQFLKLRSDYNRRTKDHPYYDFVFYLLTVYGFNNQIRFNKKGHYNIPVGKRDFNDKIRNNLERFMKRIKEKNIRFIHADFREVKIEMAKGDFLYADPPYLISTATYNEKKGWTEKDEKDLLMLLDRLDQKGVKFALSNVIHHKGRENTILKDWARNYNINHLDYHYRNSSYQIKDKRLETSEVLITNYFIPSSRNHITEDAVKCTNRKTRD